MPGCAGYAFQQCSRSKPATVHIVFRQKLFSTVDELYNLVAQLFAFRSHDIHLLGAVLKVKSIYFSEIFRAELVALQSFLP